MAECYNLARYPHLFPSIPPLTRLSSHSLLSPTTRNLSEFSTLPCSCNTRTLYGLISYATMDPNLIIFFSLLGLISFLSYNGLILFFAYLIVTLPNWYLGIYIIYANWCPLLSNPHHASDSLYIRSCFTYIRLLYDSHFLQLVAISYFRPRFRLRLPIYINS